MMVACEWRDDDANPEIAWRQANGVGRTRLMAPGSRM